MDWDCGRGWWEVCGGGWRLRRLVGGRSVGSCTRAVDMKFGWKGRKRRRRWGKGIAGERERVIVPAVGFLCPW